MRELERAEVEDVQLGVTGGKGVSSRAVWAAKRARWAAKRGLWGVEPCVAKRARALVVAPECGVASAVSLGAELSTPEAAMRLWRDERRLALRRRYFPKFKVAGDSARRMLRLLQLQTQRRARERDRGRVRLALTF